MQDLALARRLVAGDESAFDAFFTDYFPRVYRFARARLDDNDAWAEDVTQAALIRALDKIHTYRGDAALFTWLCTLCRHEISDWRHRTGRTSEVALVDDHPDIRMALEAVAALAGEDPDTELQRREVARLVRATLDHLPGRYGDVLEWKYIQELSVAEIADRLGLGYKAAESVLTRARQSFRDGFTLMEGR